MKAPITAADAYRLVFRSADSYGRMGTVLGLQCDMTRADWVTLVGLTWNSCDNIADHRHELFALVDSLTEGERKLMMSRYERSARSRLPELVTVYRGCYDLNRQGLSWSLSRRIAAQFPAKVRYRRMGDVPLLLVGTVSRDQIVLKTDRLEREVVSTRVEVLAEHRLYHLTGQAQVLGQLQPTM